VTAKNSTNNRVADGMSIEVVKAPLLLRAIVWYRRAFLRNKHTQTTTSFMRLFTCIVAWHLTKRCGPLSKRPQKPNRKVVAKAKPQETAE
jgi:hypothetical protein